MGQPAMTFVMHNAEVQPLTVCPDTSGMEVFLPINATPLAQGTYGVAYKGYMVVDGRMKLCVVKQIPLSAGGARPIEDEYAKLCSVIGLAGAITVMQSPVYSTTHGYLVTEYVYFT